MIKAWEQFFDRERNGRLELDEFQKLMEELGYEKDSKKLFTYLQERSDKPFLTLPDLDPQAWEQQIAGDANITRELLPGETQGSVRRRKPAATLRLPAVPGIWRRALRGDPPSATRVSLFWVRGAAGRGTPAPAVTSGCSRWL